MCGLATISGLESSVHMANGTILDKKPCEWGTYRQQSGFTKRFYSREDYDYAKSNPHVSCLRIEYLSDGLRVVGYLVRPLNTSLRNDVHEAAKNRRDRDARIASWFKSYVR